MVPGDEEVLAQLRRGVLEFCVLAELRNGPSYGLELAAALGARTPLFTSEGTLYPLLSRLRKQGWVETSWQESATGPPRRYYSLADEGTAALALFEQVWPKFSRNVDAVLKGQQK